LGLSIVSIVLCASVATQPATHKSDTLQSSYHLKTIRRQWDALRETFSSTPSPHHTADSLGLERAFWIAIFAPIALLGVRLYTSTDASRYLWDGAVVLSGHDPYALSASAPVLEGVRARWPVPLDHHDTVSCYPPLAQAAWALCVLASFGLPKLGFFWWKLMLTIALISSSVHLWRHSVSAAQRQAALFYLFSPLLLLECAVGAHLDILCAAAVVYALIAAERDQWRAAGLALGCAVALKLTPAILCVALWPRAKSWWRWPLWCAVIPVSTIGLPYALGAALPGSIALVAQHWNFNSPLWHTLYSRWPTSDHLIRPALAALGLALVLAQWARRRAPLAAVCRDALLGYALTNPTLYPWYLATLVACTARAPSWFAWGVITATPLTYVVIDQYQRNGVWHPTTWTLWTTALAGPVCVLVAWLLKTLSQRAVASTARATREAE
jgi:hypothetical protein